MKLYVYTVLGTVSLSMVFLLGYVCFIMFGGVVPSEGAYERFSLYPVDMTIAEYEYDVRLGVRYDLQTTGSVQSTCGVKCL